MEKSGLLTRTVYPEVPPRVEYALTSLGKSMQPILNSMAVWGDNFRENIIADKC
jgi:DNA-binding HxlR family transcriptional regulator